MTATRSATATGSATLVGVWLHDPIDPEGTSAHFPYGAGRSDSADTLGQGTLFAGREFAVVDFGEFTEVEVSVTIQVPHGAAWAADLATLDEFARLRQTVCFRDNRGRRVFGTISEFTKSDRAWGTEVAFTVSQVDYTEAVA